PCCKSSACIRNSRTASWARPSRKPAGLWLRLWFEFLAAKRRKIHKKRWGLGIVFFRALITHIVEPVIINFKWTADDLLRARHWHFRHNCRRVFRWAIHIVVITMMAICLFSLLRSGFSTTLFGLLVAGIYFYTIHPFEVRR